MGKKRVIAEAYAMPVVLTIDDETAIPIQTVLEVTTSQLFQCTNKNYKVTKDIEH
jgi:hypothetical protein